MTSSLRGTDRPLSQVYDVALLDLDGVVYVGPDAVPGAPDALARARSDGMRLAFVTNNAARPPSVVAAHLTELGIAADPAEVVTSSQAAARYLAERLPQGSHVLVVGTVGLVDALRERDLVPVDDADGPVDAVVQGFSPELNWRLLAEGSIALNRGVPWVATNADPTVPSPRGPLPGNGSLVATLRHATGREPVITGKPDPAMHRESLLRSGAERPLVVGDRLDTDIEGANAVGCASLLVLSGVTTPADLLRAAPKLRPTYLAAEVGGLLSPHPQPDVVEGGTRCGRWGVAQNGRVLRLGADRTDGAAPDGEDELDALRALCAAAWAADGPADPGWDVEVAHGDDGTARSLLERWALG